MSISSTYTRTGVELNAVHGTVTRSEPTLPLSTITGSFVKCSSADWIEIGLDWIGLAWSQQGQGLLDHTELASRTISS